MATPVFGLRSSAVSASVREIDGRTVSWFSLDGGKHRGAIGTAEGDTIARAIHLAVELGMPIVGRIASSGADVSEGLSALHAWGREAKAMTGAPGVVPAVATASYDVRPVIDDVCDEHAFLELRPNYAPNMVTGLSRLGGRPVGIVANQPMFRAGTLDIEASRKAARFVQWCDAFNFPIVTFVDTPGFEPGRDLEWRGASPPTAALAPAGAAGPPPRPSVLLRRAR